MATLTANLTSFSPNIKSVLNITEKSRSGTSVVLNISITSNLAYSSSYIGSGYVVTGTVTAYGNNKSVTIKENSVTWSGNGNRNNSTTFSITVPANISSITVGYKLSVSGLESASATATNQTLNLSKVLATTTSVTAFTDTTNPTINFSNPSGFKLRPYINFWTDANGTQLGNTIYPSDIPSTGSSISSPYTWNLTEEQRNTIRNWFGTRTTGYATIGIKTYDGSTSLGSSSKGAIFTNNLSSPTFTNFEIEDSNTTTQAITGDSSKFILGYSTLKITIDSTNKATANKGATMSYYLINNTQYTYNENFTLELEKWNSNAITITAVDSRGISTSVTKTLTTASYSPLTKSTSSILRDGNVSEETQLNYSGSVTSVLPNGNNNTITASYKFKKTDESTYTIGSTNITPTSSNDSYSFVGYIIGDLQTGFEINNSYDVEVEVEDVLSSAKFTFTLGSGIPAIAIKGNNVAIHGGYDEQLGGTQLNGDVYLNGELLTGSNIITLTRNTNQTSLTTGSYKKVEFNKYCLKGNKLLMVDNGVKIGQGVNKIKVSGRIQYQLGGNVTSTRYLRIVKNNTDNTLAWAPLNPQSATGSLEISLPPTLCEVEENDIIYLMYYTSSSSDTIYSVSVDNSTMGAATYLTVEDASSITNYSNSGGGGAGVDYIIEQGTDGIWGYRKWNSGVAECWFLQTQNQTHTTTTQWGSCYESPSFYYTYPSGLFIEEPNHDCRKAGGVGGWLEVGGGGTKDRTPTLYLIYPVQRTTSYTGWIGVSAIGKWK